MNQSTLRTEQQAHWQHWIARWQQSGQSQAAFCDTHNLVYHQFTYWRRKAEPDTPDSVCPSGFVTVQRHDRTATGLTLTLPNGMQIQNLTSQHLAWLPQLLAQLS